MPIYEYGCTHCGHELEIIQKMNDSPLEKCPACEQNTLKKKVSAAGFRLKGTGWYQTDFKNQKKPAASEEKTSDTTATTPPTSTDNASTATTQTSETNA
jgi:putative FmdB family regulatory protein